MAELKLENSLVDERYKILERKGQGSYAEIFIALDSLQDGQLVIVKALNILLQGTPDPDLEQTLIENFQNEATALDTVCHPNIIRHLGHGKAIDLNSQKFQYIVLEYMPGGDLLQKCRQKRLSFDEMLYYANQICFALSHAHQCNVIHRDIKPNNLLLSADGRTVKIADFGVAKISPQANEEVTRVGTDIYAPPEHHPLITTGELVEPNKLTPSADIYSLAKTIYTLLSGRAPRQYKQRPITELPPELQNELWAEELLTVLRRATDSQIEKRYASAAAFYHNLEEVEAAGQEVTRVRASANRGAMTSARPSLEIQLEPEFSPDEAISDRGQQTREGRIVIQLPQRKPAIEQEKPTEKISTAAVHNSKLEKTEKSGTARENSQTKAGFWERADNFVVINRKKILTIWAIILFFSLSLLIARTFHVLGLQDQSRSAVVLRSVSVRTGPSTSSDVVGWLRDGAKLRILQRESNNWFLVEITDPEDLKTANASRGWVYGDYLKTSLDADSDSEKEKEKD